jgi:hypothetical protein
MYFQNNKENREGKRGGKSLEGAIFILLRIGKSKENEKITSNECLENL